MLLNRRRAQHRRCRGRRSRRRPEPLRPAPTAPSLVSVTHQVRCPRDPPKVLTGLYNFRSPRTKRHSTPRCFIAFASSVVTSDTWGHLGVPPRNSTLLANRRSVLDE